MAVNLAPTFNIGDGMVTDNVITTGVLTFSDLSRPHIFETSNQHFLVEGIAYVGDIFAQNGSYQSAWMSYNSDGSVNSTFGNNGSLLTEPLLSTILQPDGKILGINAITGLLGRYNPDRSLDTSFGNNGWASQSNNINVGGTYSFSNATRSHDIAMQADGKIVVLGAELAQGGSDYSPLVVTRYNTDGSLDTNFSGDGILPLNFDAAGVRQATVQADGKILVAISGYSAQSIHLLRLNSDGSLDNSFSNPIIGNAYGTKTFDLLQQTDGKIILASDELNSTTFNNEVVLRRYNLNGIPDSTFGTNGVLTSLGNGGDVVLQSDGKILLAGNTGGQFTLIRYNPDGSLDNSFDGDGRVSAPIGGNENTAYSVTVQADNKILVTGLHVDSFGGGRPANGEFVVVRYNPNGSLDATFDPVNTLNGTSTYIENAAPVVLDNTVQIYDAELSALNSGNGNYSGASVTLTRQGGVNVQDVFSGSGNLSFNGSNVVLSGINIGSLSNTNGTLAITFNANATQARVNEALSSVAYSNSSDVPPSSVQINWTFNDHNTGAQGTGGALSTVGSTTINITAVNDAPTFANIGKVTNGFDGTSFNYAKSVITQADGKIILAGYSHDGDHSDQFELVRYNPNGTLDTSFSGDGRVTTPNISILGDFINDSALQADGKIVVVGNAYDGGLNADGQPTTDFILLRYNTDGSQDLSFGNNGKVITDFGLLGDDNASSVSIQSNGKLLVVGSSWNGSTFDFALAKYNPNGSLDTSFGSGGKLITDINVQNEFASGAFIQPDGKIVVAGSSVTYYLSGPVFNNFGLVRYNADGTLDSTFGSGGKAATQMILNATDIGMQADGKFIIAGTAYNSSTDFALTRYNSNGTLDTSFGVNGQVLTDISNTDADNGYKVAIQADGKIILVGISVNDFAVIRYNVNGSLDSSFGNGGKVTTDFNGGFDTGFSVTIQADGKILVAGDSYDLNDSKTDFALVRYNIDGSVDAQFNPQNTQSSLHGTPLFSFFENGVPVLLERNVQIYDGELSASGNYSGASINLARQGGVNLQDIFSATGNLSFSNGNAFLSGLNIGTVTNSNGLLTITFNTNATQAKVNEALSSLAYSNNSEAPPTTVQINWSFNDGNTGTQGIGGTLSATGSTVVNIVPINDLPILTGTKATLISGSEDASYTVTASNLLAGFTDAEGNTLSVTNLSANHGSVVNNGNGTFTITPEASYSGVVNLSYLVSDGTGGTGATQSFQLLGSDNSPLADANSRYASLASLSPSNAIDALVTSFDNLAFFDVSSYSTLNSSSVSGTLTNGDFFSVSGRNLLGYPTTVTRFDYNSTGNIQLSTLGTVTQANEFSDVVGKLNNIVVTDNSYGAGHQVVYTFNGSFDVNGVGTDSINNIEVKQDGNSVYIAGNLYSDDSSPSGISGTITSFEFHLGSYTTQVTGLNISYSAFDSYTNLTDLLTNALSGNNAINGTASNDIMLGFAGNDILYGLAGNDTIDGGAGNDTLDGGLGADSLLGGDGDDTYLIDNIGDSATEQVNEGTDLVKINIATAGLTYVLGANIENGTLTNSVAFNLTGNSLNNILTGNAAANILTGGAGDDTYIIDSSDTVVEDSNQGTDTIQTSGSYILSANLENLTLTGFANINGTGNATNNVLTGNAGNNTLDGGAGTDTLIGGAGNDTYIIDNGDTVVENANEGTDTIQASYSYVLGANLENLTLTGSGDFSGTGNGGNNVITGNSGNNTLNYTGGFDTLNGGAGTDTASFSSFGSAVWVSLTSSIEGWTRDQATVTSGTWRTIADLNNVENITGSAYADELYGNSGSNVLAGGGGNDLLDGGLGADSLLGGDGDDTYLIDNIGDSATEQVNEGTDLVKINIATAGLTYVLGANIENGTLTNSVAFNLTGNSLNNILTGNAAANILTGGAGDDTYIIDSSDTVVEDSNQGTDTIQTSGSYILSANLENLTLTGFANINGTGNATNNVLTGNAGNNTLDGGAGTDTLIGGAGNDTYIIDNGDTVVENANEGTDTIQASYSYVLGANLENLTLTGSGDFSGTGNGGNNVITGNSGNNTLNYTGGFDTLNGGAGTDTASFSSFGSAVWVSLTSSIEGWTRDQATVTSGTWRTIADLNNVENITGSAYADELYGNSGSNVLAGGGGNDLLDGGLGADSLLGGDGDDTYLIDNIGDSATEQVNEGTDLVKINIATAGLTYVLGANIENGTLTNSVAFNLTGNSLNNILTGNAAANILTGGAGDDTYIIDSSDTVVEDSNQGTDTIQTSGSYILSANLENLTLTGFANINGTGNATNNVLTGNAGNNTLDGGAGTDTLIGGAGNDTYIIDNGDTVVENANEGTDTIQASYSYVLGANLENLTLTGSGDFSGTGNGGNNVITGNSGNNTLNYTGGFDTLNGGAGTDTASFSSFGSAVWVSLTSSIEGWTRDQATVTSGTWRTIADLNNVENITGSAYADELYGNSGSNVLAGGGGNDLLDGGLGADSLLGGDGDDTYLIDNIGDSATEQVNEGTDLVKINIATAGLTYVLGANIENGTLTNSVAFNLTGNSLNNILTGNAAANILTGGAGDDTYIIDSSDTVVEDSNQGTDTIQTSGSYILSANLENLTLTGFANINGTGNATNNVLTGNAGNNTLDGGAGTDTLIGGAGNDTYIIDNGDTVVENANEGTDTIQASYSYVLGANLENLTLTGSGDFSGTGNGGNNVITGNSGNNTLNYTGGFDTLNGGAGTDTASFSSFGSAVWVSLTSSIEGWTRDQATVTSGTWRTIADLNNVENITGSAYADELYGNSGSNVLAGGGGNDLLDGGLGADSLLGGDGDDTYLIDNIGDSATEQVNEGTDLVKINIATAGLTYVLGANIENGTLTNSVAFNLTGNSLNNILTGNAAANILTGGAGDDTYIIDSSDTVVEDSNQGTDTIQTSGSYILSANLENLTLTGFANINGTGNATNNVLTGNAGNNTLDGGAGTDTLIGGAGNDTYIIDNGDTVVENANEGTDTIQASYSYVLGANLENLTLTGSGDFSGTGNGGNNVITGNSGNNTLNYTGGFDTLNGGAGTDTASFSSFGSAVWVSLTSSIEGWTRDQATVTSGTWRTIADLNNVENITGSAYADELYGNSGSNVLAGGGGNDLLDGGLGADSLLGGDGDDTYLIDNIGDSATEQVNEGTDLVKINIATAGLTYVLGANIENGTLTNSVAFNLTGNSLNNILTGNAAANILTGGAGDDTYIIDSSDTVVEDSNQGTDTIQTSGSYILSANLENLTLTGFANINGTGNATNNVLTGNAGNNTLDGGAGTDTLIGGAGNDTYIIDNGDTVVENANEGTDTIQASYSYVLGANLENLTLTGSGDFSGTGNGGNNVITGNSGNNTLNYTGGFDTLNGGAGTDTASFSSFGSAVWVSLTSSIEGWTRDQATVTSGTWRTIADLNNVENITGSAYADELYGNSGSNVLAGGGGNDLIYAGYGNDILIGGAGNDAMGGGIGADIFKWNLADKGTPGNIVTNTDTINDFSIVEGDKLDLRDLLSDESSINILNYIDVAIGPGNTTIHISSTGGFTGGNYSAGNEDARIVLNNIDLFTATGMTNETNLLQNLIQNNKLIIDT